MLLNVLDRKAISSAFREGATDPEFDNHRDYVNEALYRVAAQIADYVSIYDPGFDRQAWLDACGVA